MRKTHLKRSFSHAIETIQLTKKENSFLEITEHKQYQKTCIELFLKSLEEWKALELYNYKKYSEIASPLLQIDRARCESTFGLYGILNETFVTLAVQARNLALKLEDDIIMELKELCRRINAQVKVVVEQEKQEKKILVSKKQHMEKVNSSTSKIRSVHLQYFNSRKSMEESQIVNIIVATSAESNLEKRLKQSQKTTEFEKEFKLQEFRYQQTVEEYNHAVTHYRETILSLLQDLEAQQKQSIRTVHESLLKTNLHLSTKHNTILHQVQRIGEKVSSFSVEECMNATIDKLTCRSYNSKSHDLENVTYTPYIGFLTVTIENIFERKLDGIIKFGKSKEMKQIIQKVMTQECPEYLSSIDNIGLQNLLTYFINYVKGEDVSHLRVSFIQALNDVENRISFISCMQLYRLIGKFSMNFEQIASLYRMTNMFLDACLEQKDSFLAKQSMALQFTYYVCPGQQRKDKVYLQQFLRHHPIWHIRQFWESALLECIYQEKKNNIKMSIATNDKQQEIEADRNAAFNQLACLTHNMILFGIPDKDTRQFASKYIKLYGISRDSAEDIEVHIPTLFKPYGNCAQKNIVSALQEFNSSINNPSVEALIAPYLNS